MKTSGVASQPTKTITPSKSIQGSKPTWQEGLKNLEASKDYKNLAPERKRQVIEHVYDKYVAPTIKTNDSGLGASEIRTFYQNYINGVDNRIAGLRAKNPNDPAIADYQNQKIKLTQRLAETPISPNVDTTELRKMFIDSRLGGSKAGAPTTLEKAEDIATHYYASLNKGAIKTARGLADLDSTVVHAVAKNWPFYVKSMAPLGNHLLHMYDRHMDDVHDFLNEKEDLANSMLGNHYNENLKTKVAEVPGKVLGFAGDHPAYVLVPEMLPEVAGALGAGPLIDEGLAAASPMAKYAQKALKGAAEGFIVGKLEGENTKGAGKTARQFMAYEMALPALNDVLKDYGVYDLFKRPPKTPPPFNGKPNPNVGGGGGGGAVAYLSKLLGIGRARAVTQSLNAARGVTSEELALADPNKMSTKLTVAGRQLLNEAAQKLGYKDIDDAVAKGASKKVNLVIGNLINRANDEVGYHNPDLVAVQVSNELKEIAQNPLGAGLQNLAKKHGIDPVASTTGEVVESIGNLTGANQRQKAEKIVSRAINSSEQLIEGLGPGAASIKQKQAVDTLLDLVETNIGLQGRANKLTFLWGIRDNIPKALVPVLKQEMKDIHGPSAQVWDQATVALDNHIDKLIETGHIKPNDMRGVFRSTRLTGEPTKWQQQLDKELEQVRLIKKHGGGGEGGGSIEMERTEGGKLKMGADTERLSRILGSSLYGHRGPDVVVKELLQNAYDATRGMEPGKGQVTVNFEHSFDATKSSYMTVSDNGRGMTAEEIYTVFTNLGASGKTQEIEASGGFGLAKAAPFMVADELEVRTIGTRPDGTKEMTTFKSTPDDITKGEVVPVTKDVPAETPTGTVIKSTFFNKSGLWDAENFAKDSQRSLRAPANLTITKTSRWSPQPDVIKPNIVDADVKEGTVQAPGAAIDVYRSTQREPMAKAMGQLNIEIHNNGIYQFTKQEWLGGAKELRGVPSRIIMDVKSSVPEGHNHYPFTANRESLAGDTNAVVAKAINDIFINPAYERMQKELGKIYATLPNMNLSGGRTAPIFDSGSRFTQDELTQISNNPALVKIADVFDNVAGNMIEKLKGSGFHKFFDYPPEKFVGENVERLGLVFSDKVHGVYVKNPASTKATMFINPLQYDEAAEPDQVASLMHHTLKHELIHDWAKGHNETFTSAEAKISHFLGIDFEINSMRSIKNAYTEPGTQRLRKELGEAIRIYKESRGRPEVTPDLLGGEEISARKP